MDKDAYLDKHRLHAAFAQSKLSWDTIERIADDYRSRIALYESVASEAADKMMRFEKAHSVRYRVKTVDSLIEKIIRKTIEGETGITEETYRYQITDLIGIRILYVFKDDYYTIHEQITREFGKYLEGDVDVNLRRGDNPSRYKKIRKKNIKENSDYRSLHYIIRDSRPKSDIKIELQTRTLFEEGWSEINHELVYKQENGPSRMLLDKISNVLSALTGDCDSTAEVMLMLSQMRNGQKEIEQASGLSAYQESLDSLFVEIIRGYQED